MAFVCEPPQLPIAFTQTLEDLLNITNDGIRRSRSMLDQIAKTSPTEASFANVMLPLAQEENERINTQGLTDFFQNVAPTRSLCDASVEAQKLWTAYSQEVDTRDDLYRLVQVVKDKNEILDLELQYYLNKTLSRMIRDGLALPNGPTRDQSKAIKIRIDELSVQCKQTLYHEAGGIWFSAEELAGLPHDVFGKLRSDGSETDEKFWLTFKRNDLTMCLKYCTNSMTSKRAFIGNENKCPANVVPFKELVSLRAELAKLMGYKSYADYKTQDKMMSFDSVQSFLAELEASIAPQAEIEMRKMCECKKRDLIGRGAAESDIDDRMYLWDTAFYTRLLQESQQDLDETRFSELFSLDSTMRGLLDIYEELFGMQIIELLQDSRETLVSKQKQAEDAITWHKDVKVYSVWDEEAMGGNFLGYLYLDLLQRPGKRDHPCNSTFQAGFDLSNGARHYPSTALLAALPQPTPSKPTLLRHRNVLTLFHELGHGIHYLVGRTKFASTYGTSTNHDFVEIPSKMLENWCWDPSILQRLSRHYTYLSPSYLSAWESEHPGLPQPAEKGELDLLTSLTAFRSSNLAFLTLTALSLAKYDFIIHGAASPEEVEKMDLGEIYNRVRKEVKGLSGPEVYGEGYGWGCGQARFQHMFSSSYAAGYYVYALASVYSAALFDLRFRESPMDRIEGRRYRRIILGRGGSECAINYLKEYLGCEPGSEAFAKQFENTTD
ncbi:metallopeptidase [Mollisia scopiformis]|uniref:Metallopeptidase n=1 Tax=Mollisia scopiformis TaxID=149040 RepID=A0A194XPU8_MOLSC|nr:metallopeptidase [Mollisia scopiformis]KUJ22186.1 metallopeptidase [Mollisia scopiformis]